MAQTPAAVQAVLGTNGTNAQILIADEGAGGTEQRWYVSGKCDVAGRERWVTTTASSSAAVQAAAILTALRA